ncbi:MAG TPA: Asp-tRNA(Asn)/Glu-tRNA(Gln) amidotransferase subunit GatB [Elusimicrobiota bacterium]|nr:Asp-tRNA(Asn)/Glu-tRNA(Gln) amidotransferase subunit GatB [Elusimicrobiota bacterium]
MATKYEMVVGLEVHAQLATQSKLFCACPTDGFGAPPNSRICPVCTGQPGVLPVLNRRAAELAFRAALALGCRITPISIFARKNYFYPDLPKAYQISQYELPFSEHGGLEIRTKDGHTQRVRIHRIHMEEDAGKLLHAIGAEKLDCSLVDFNRGGTPLVEIVSEPDLRSSDEAYAYLTALKEILQYAGVSGCNMEKGEMRCDANVSLRPEGTEKFGTRAEIKNLNSFHNVKLALEHEFVRQAEILDSGGRVVQETRLWDAERGMTASMRSKEEAHDYRYFPDPDLLPLEADADWIGRIQAELPELPARRRARLAAEFGLSDYDAEVLSGDKELGDYFLAAKPHKKNAKTLSNLMTTELLARLNAESLSTAEARGKIRPEHLSELAGIVAEGKISSKIAKEVFSRLWDGKITGLEKDGNILVAIERQGLAQVSDEGRIKAWVQEALAANPKAAEDLRGGKERAAGSIVGAVMKLSKGKANPALVNRLIKEAVKS